METNLLTLAQEDGFQGKRAASTRGGEWKGPCPACKKGTDRLRIQPYVEPLGYFECNQCGVKGSAIQWLMEIRKLSAYEACKLVNYHKICDTFGSGIIPRHFFADVPVMDAKLWRTAATAFSRWTEQQLWSEAGQSALAYLRGRGLKDKTIKAAHLGYNQGFRWGKEDRWGRRGVNLNQGIVIPWFDGLEVIKINIRDETVKEGDGRYKMVAGSQSGLYLESSLHRRNIAILAEGEIDALSIAQAVGEDGRIAVVGTGSDQGARGPQWRLQLGALEKLYIAFGTDASAEKASQWWLDKITRSERLRPLFGDANQMLVAGLDLWEEWIEPIVNRPENSVCLNPNKLIQVDYCTSCGASMADCSLDWSYWPEKEGDDNYKPYCSNCRDITTGEVKSKSLHGITFPEDFPATEKDFLLALQSKIPELSEAKITFQKSGPSCTHAGEENNHTPHTPAQKKIHPIPRWHLPDKYALGRVHYALRQLQGNNEPLYEAVKSLKVSSRQRMYLEDWERHLIHLVRNVGMPLDKAVAYKQEEHQKFLERRASGYYD